LFTMEEPMGAYDLDHRTTPFVLMISKVSNIVAMRRDGYQAPQNLDRSQPRRGTC
jgi:hypothetical protein